MLALRTIHRDEIIIPENRIRREFDEKALEELATSIEDKGLLHPPVLRTDGRTLVAGERRLRAMSALHRANRKFHCNGFPIPLDHIPITTLGDLDSYRLRETELEENVIRRDLSWQDRSRAVAELHSLRQSQRESLSMRDFATELLGEIAEGGRATAVANTIRVAKWLDDAEVAAAPDERTALKIITRKADAAHRAKLALEFDLGKTSHIVRHGDSREFLREVGDNSIDVILTDPPYGIDAHDFGSQADARHEYEDSLEYALDCNNVLAFQASRILRSNAYVFIFCSLDTFESIRAMWLEQGFNVFPTPLIWDKVGIGMLPWPNFGPRRTHEYILFARRGERRLSVIVPNDVIAIPGIQKPRFGAEKPAALFSQLLSWVSRPGDIVLDPFAGAGPIIPAANSNSCIAIAFEQSKEKFDYILTRIEET